MLQASPQIKPGFVPHWTFHTFTRPTSTRLRSAFRSSWAPSLTGHFTLSYDPRQYASDQPFDQSRLRPSLDIPHAYIQHHNSPFLYVYSINSITLNSHAWSNIFPRPPRSSHSAAPLRLRPHHTSRAIAPQAQPSDQAELSPA